jgi:uncharacterized protein YoxC
LAQSHLKNLKRLKPIFKNLKKQLKSLKKQLKSLKKQLKSILLRRFIQKMKM